MSFARVHRPIKVGLLFDFLFPPPGTWDVGGDFVAGFSMAIDEGRARGLVDREVELVRRDVDGLPRGDVKTAIDAWQELVDEGALVIIGPLVSENAVALREHVERGSFVPSISWCGTEEWLGEWTFALSDGSLSEEPFVIATLLAAAGIGRIGVSYERSHIGSEYLRYLRQACDRHGVEIVVAAPIAQTDVDAGDVVRQLHAADPEAIVHVGFGIGLIRINAALAAIGWDPPRYTTTAWENGFLSDEVFGAFRHWIGLEHYDEGNAVGQAVLDRFAARHGRRPEYTYPLYGFDVGNVVVHALSYAEPLSPTGVKHAIERVKMLPAASGSPGTHISYGRWKRNGWHGPGYLTARSVADDLRSTVLRGRFDGPVATATPSAASHQATVRRFFDAMNDGDIDAAYALVQPGCTWFSLASREFRTLTQMRAALEWVNGSAVERPIQITVVGMVADGERVAVQCEGHAITTAGRPYENLYHFLFEFDGGLISRLWEYNDTAHVKDVFRIGADGTLSLG